MRRFPLWRISEPPPPLWAGLVAAVALVAACTGVIYPLAHAAPVVSLGVVYLLAVLIVSSSWGLRLGALTALLSAAAFNYFHLSPVGRFTLRDSRNWVALITFVVAAVLISSLAELARERAREAEQRRAEADLAAELARLLLGGGRLEDSLPAAAHRIATGLGLGSAPLQLGEVQAGERRVAFPLWEGPHRLGTLLVPADAGEPSLRRVQERVVPALEAVLSAARDREALQGEVVETAALRRADDLKTALLRSVSHDLRSPLTAIQAAGDALASSAIQEDEREELVAVISGESRRLGRLVDNLLDLSRLEAGAAEPHREWVSLEELVHSAVDELGGRPDQFSLSLDRDLPLIQADAVQLERALVNVLENARRHGEGHPVSVRARAVRRISGGASGERVIVRIVDRGPGIPAAQLERVFEPFYRAGSAREGNRGSGLGLAIARGFVEANGGHIHVESLPGQGASFVLELPLAEAEVP
ncbi:MAG TPA: ATP-binding protein [Solirubrobacteraceae bacterium]|jgi:two-component system sensor histidine kinase KdpD|nr:ATP-binding protein [Solirubrobacteraceae bacterium]